MMIEIPTIPAGMLILLSFFAPYLQAVIQAPGWKPWVKKLVTVALAAVLTAVVFVFYYAMTGDAFPEWPVFILLALVVMSASYALVTKPSATALEKSTHKE